MRFIILLLIGFFLFSCSQENKYPDSKQSGNMIAKEISYQLNEKVQSKFYSKVSEWNELNAFEGFLTTNFTKTNVNQALENSVALTDLSKSLRDSILPKELNNLSLNARLNLLYTECLRLKDISTISSIEDKEVDKQINKVFDAFSSVNAKINAMLEQKELELLYGDDFIEKKEEKEIKKNQVNTIPKRFTNKRIKGKKNNNFGGVPRIKAQTSLKKKQ